MTLTKNRLEWSPSQLMLMAEKNRWWGKLTIQITYKAGKQVHLTWAFEHQSKIQVEAIKLQGEK